MVVVKLPDMLERRAQKIEAAMARRAKGDEEWIEGTIDLAVELAGARADHGNDDSKFGTWIRGRFGDNRLPKNERAILIRWGRDPKGTRILLTNTDNRSIQYIDRTFPSSRNGDSRLASTRKTPTFRSSTNGLSPSVGGDKTHAVHAALQASEAAGIKLTQKQVAEALDVSVSTVIEAARDLKAAQAAEIFTYTKAQDQHVEARIRALDKAREMNFNERVRLQVLEENAPYRDVLDQLQKEAREQEEIHRSLNNDFKPIFTEAEYTVILTCLHPDNVASKEKRDAAFKAFNAMKFQLTGKR